MGRYALGLADVARLGGDIGSEWSSARLNLPDLLVRMCTGGLWWVGDPDVFHMREENLRMSQDEAWCLTGTVGLLGGMFVSSDFPSQWSAGAAEQVRCFWNDAGPMPPQDLRVAYAADGTPRLVRVSCFRAGEWVHRVAVYNWGDEAATVTGPLDAVGLAGRVDGAIRRGMPANAPVRLEAGRLVCEAMPPHSLRIAELRGPMA
jgi:hypothetical protein